MVVQLLDRVLLVAEVAIGLPILYLAVVSLAALLTTQRRVWAREVESAQDGRQAYPDFAVLVPAHDEELGLGELLESLARLAYPQERYTVYVVADNCTDRTAELARATGWVRVYERYDLDHKGKGFALSWIFQTLEAEHAGHDAYVVLDADTVVEPGFLAALARGLTEGAEALQANNNVLNVAASPSTALRWLALTLMNHVRPLGRNALGASATLTGDCVCLSRELVRRYPWRAFGVGEDYPYYLTLVQHGVRVRYVPDAVLRSQMPTTFARMRSQDIRWEAGELGQPTWRLALGLLRAGLRSRDLVRAEAVAELLTPPLSLLVFGSALALPASLVLQFSAGLLLALLLLCGLICYVASALYLGRPSRAVYRALLYAPGFIAWKLWVYVVLRRSKRHSREWVRTSRVASAK